MIQPERRSLLTDALTPPPGSTFDCGVATTYSLDLVTLLTLPLHLAWMGTGVPSEPIDPLPVLEALRRTAGRLTVFCQRGRLQVPRSASPLLSLLEGMVHEALARHGGAFHPKVWLLRFAGASGEVPSRLRLLVLSRNVTDDRSWDLSLSLDGVVGRKPIQRNRPLCAFLKQTLAMSRKPLGPQREADLAQLVADASRCEWELPERFEDVRFHALGIGPRPQVWLPRHPDGAWTELGVLSPFVTGGALKQLADTSAAPLFLVSRPEELDKLPEPLPGGFNSTWVLDEKAEVGDQEDDTPGRLTGLHAKVYVGCRRWDTHLFLGSANATDAALVAGRNVEFMAELVGKTSKVGGPADWQGESGLQQLLAPYVRSPGPDEEKLKQERQLEALRDRLVQATLELSCKSSSEGWSLHLRGVASVDRGGAELLVWPVTLHADRAVVVEPGGGDAHDAGLLLGILAAQDVTSFTAFRARLGASELSFVLDLPLSGAPAGRELEVLKAALRNREGFVRYLTLLLGDWEPAAQFGSGTSRQRSQPAPGAGSDAAPILEMLARAFAREPQRLEQVRQLIVRLSSDPDIEAGDIVPPGFLDLWHSVERAMELGNQT